MGGENGAQRQHVTAGPSTLSVRGAGLSAAVLLLQIFIVLFSTRLIIRISDVWSLIKENMSLFPVGIMAKTPIFSI